MSNVKAIIYESEIMEMKRASFVIQDENNRIINESDYESEYDILNLSSDIFEEYFEALCKICQIESWNNLYDNKTFSGEHWKIKIVYDNNNERILEGYNSYPEEYNDFLDISNSYL